MDAKTMAQAMGIPQARADKWIDGFNKAIEYAQLTTRLRLAAFLAQVGHETQSLLYVKELGGASYFAKYDAGTAIGARLGNTIPGDGAKFPGRGLIQVTGRFNYRECSLVLFGDERLLKNPELLEQPENAALSAAWFWKKNSLNNLADADRFTDLSVKVNGGKNGLEDRKQRYRQALAVLK